MKWRKLCFTLMSRTSLKSGCGRARWVAGVLQQAGGDSRRAGGPAGAISQSVSADGRHSAAPLGLCMPTPSTNMLRTCVSSFCWTSRQLTRLLPRRPVSPSGRSTPCPSDHLLDFLPLVLVGRALQNLIFRHKSIVYSRRPQIRELLRDLFQQICAGDPHDSNTLRSGGGWVFIDRFAGHGGSVAQTGAHSLACKRLLRNPVSLDRQGWLGHLAPPPPEGRRP